MSEEQTEEFTSHLKSIDTLVRGAYAIGTGLVIVGAWVGTIQMAVNSHEAAKTEHANKIRALEINESQSAERLRNIETIVNRIDRKLNP